MAKDVKLDETQSKSLFSFFVLFPAMFCALSCSHAPVYFFCVFCVTIVKLNGESSTKKENVKDE